MGLWCVLDQVLTAFAACLKLGGLVGAAAEFVASAPALPSAEQLASLSRIQRRQLARGKSASEKPPPAGEGRPFRPNMCLHGHSGRAWTHKHLCTQP